MSILAMKRGALTHRSFGLRLRLPSRNDDLHLFNSRENARRLIEAYDEVVSGRGRVMTLEELRAEVGFG